MEKSTGNKTSGWQIRAGAIMSYVGIAVNVIAGMLYTPWIIRNIGQSGYGLFTLASSLIGMFMVDFGISAAVSKFLSQYIAKGEKEKIGDFLGIVYKLYLIIDIILLVVFSIVYFNIELIYANLSADEIALFKVIFIITAIYNLIAFPFVTLNGILTAYEKFFHLKLCNIINKIGTVICTIVALLLGGGIAIGVTYTLRLVLMTIVFHKVLKLNMKKFFFECHFKMLPALAITAIIGIVLFMIVPNAGSIVFLIKCGLVAIVYALLMWFTVWNGSEKDLVTDMFGTLKRKVIK